MAISNTAKVKALLKRRAKLKKVALPLELDPRFTTQNKFVNSTERFLAAQCSRRAGKSSGLALRFFKTMERHPKSQCVYLSLTFDSAKSIMWPVLQELNEKFRLGCTFLEGKMVMTHPNGSKLRLYGADQKNFIKRLKGQKAPGIAIDEAQDFGPHIQSLIDDVLTPMIIDYPDGWLAITGTPGPVPQGHFFDITNNRKFGYDFHSWTLLDNPYVINPEEFIQTLIVKNGWDSKYPTLLREWRNVWVLDVHALWVRYSESINHFNKLPSHVKKWNYLLGIDLGFKDADALAVLAWSESDPNIYLIEELITAKQSLTPLINQIKAMQAKYDLQMLVIDAGALGKKMAEEMRNVHGIPVQDADKSRKQENVEFLNDALRLGRFKANKDSRFAQDSYLVQIDWDKSSPDKIVVKKKPHSDIIDSVLYAFKKSPYHTYVEAKVAPKVGSREAAEQFEKQLFENHMAKMQHEQDKQDGKGITWELDKNGVPPWLKW